MALKVPSYVTRHGRVDKIVYVRVQSVTLHDDKSTVQYVPVVYAGADDVERSGQPGRPPLDIMDDMYAPYDAAKDIVALCYAHLKAELVDGAPKSTPLFLPKAVDA